MKKLSILFVCILTGLAIISCSNDDSNHNILEADNQISIVGKWEFSKEGYIVNGQENLIDHFNTQCGKDYIEFLSDRTFKVVYYGKDVNNKCTSYNQEGPYKKEGLTITLTGLETQPEDFEILALDTNILKLKSNADQGIYIFKKTNTLNYMY